ncbi:MAG TPA: hypothetical protein VJT09_04930 [Pyrinomonadaceae bacterium]|nr:hypothetical protein [Pyrinomonadaceae bacterium]
MLRISTLLLAFTFIHTGLSARQDKQPVEPDEAVINLAECKQETKVIYSKFGSEKVVVKGRRGSRCIVERTSETEGGYVRRECRIPVSRGKLSLTEQAVPAPSKNPGKYGVAHLDEVSKYCKIIKTGNLLGGE